MDTEFLYFPKKTRQTVMNVHDFLTDSELAFLHKYADEKLIQSETKTVRGCYLDFSNKRLYDKLMAVVLRLNDKNYRFSINRISKLQLMEYRQGSYMDPHTDCAFDVTCKLSLLIPLSTQDVDYTGGDFILNNGNRPRSETKGLHKIPMTKGSIVAFPSYMIHEVKEVTSGVRRTMWAGVYGDDFLV